MVGDQLQRGLEGFAGGVGVASRVIGAELTPRRLRQKDLQPASKWRCGARNALACLPFVLFASWGAMIITSMSTFEIEPRIKVGLMLLGNLLILLLCGCIGLNIIISLLNPARNMVDYLAGTRLSRQ